MLVSKILQIKGKNVVTTTPEKTLQALVPVFKSKRLGAIVVTDRKGKVVGMLSERDVVLALANHGESALTMNVAELMARPVTTCGPDDDIKNVMAIMTHRRARHLPVVEHGRLSGIVSIGDVVKYHLAETELEVNVLRDYARVHVV